MRIAISGSTGLVGSKLTAELQAVGHEVMRLVRAPPKSDSEIRWDIKQGTIESEKLEGVDAVIHLAGENVGDGRWTEAKKKAIRDSRVLGTRLLVSALIKLDRKPRVLVSASAMGFYGDRGDEVLTEASAPGTGFFPDICQEWEAETSPAAAEGIRVAELRIGAVLSNEGGAFPKLVMPFRFFVGGKIGSGRQYLSWITRDDLVRIIITALNDDRYQGAINAVSPEPVTNAELARALGKKLSRPSFATVPAFAVKVLFGEMGEETVLSSTRMEPARLKQLGFDFEHATLDAALDRLLAE